MQMQQRDIDVLTTIIEDFIETGHPVGSRTVAKRSGLKLSPASIRNTMADLTEGGFLDQPHTSAGRVPTAAAFRFYLNRTVRLNPLPESERERIERTLSQSGLEMTDLLREASRLLSQVSRQVSMVLAPSSLNVRWREIGFSLVKPGLVLAVLMLDHGLVLNKLLPVEAGVTQDDLVAFSNYLNEHFTGRTLAEARAKVLQELNAARRRLKRLCYQSLSLAQLTFDRILERELFVDGAVNMLDHVEFTDTAKMRELLTLLEERSKLLELLDKTLQEDGIKITLGPEAALGGGVEISCIASPYGDDPGSSAYTGVVSVIGPLRMDYAKTVPLVDYLAKTLTQILKSRF